MLKVLQVRIQAASSRIRNMTVLIDRDCALTYRTTNL